jgi:hypothetical protein
MKYLKLSNFIKKTFIELTVMEVQGPTSGITFSLAESQGGGGITGSTLCLLYSFPKKVPVFNCGVSTMMPLQRPYL